jgi:hypothetical protein
MFGVRGNRGVADLVQGSSSTAPTSDQVPELMNAQSALESGMPATADPVS